MDLPDKKIEAIRNKLQEADGSFKKYPTFIALTMLNSVSLNFDTGPQGKKEAQMFLREIGLPESYVYQLKSYVKVPEVLRSLGFEIRRIEDGE